MSMRRVMQQICKLPGASTKRIQCRPKVIPLPPPPDRAPPQAMQNQEGLQVQVDGEVDPRLQHLSFGDQDIMQQPSAICAEKAEKIPFLGDKEPLTSLAAEYQSGSAIWLEKINVDLYAVLGEQYAAFRRTQGDGNCFFRSFMFSYPICLHVFLHNHEHILVSQDVTEVDRIKANVEQCRKTLQSLGYTDFTFEDFFSIFLEQLDCVLQGSEESISHDELILRSRDQSVSDYVVMFVRFVTSGEIRKRSEFFNPFISGLTDATVEQFRKSSVEPMGEESDHVYITALSDALGVPIRVVYLDRSLCNSGGVSVNHHDFVFTGNDLPDASDSSEKVCPFITLLYRPGH